MKLPSLSLSLVAILASLVVAAAAAGWFFSRPKPAPHVQIVLASDGALMVAGVPGRSMRARIQDPTFWNGSSATASALVDFLRGAEMAERRGGTYDGRAMVIVDDHASFQIEKILIASARASYPEVSYINGTVAELPPRGRGADKAKPADSYVKDCSAKPTPAGCAAAFPVGPGHQVK